MSSNIFVSVCMITYNHEKYISQAIEGVLLQRTDFPIELIIGEDCSTDKTREICIAYQQKYPSIIKLQLSENNKGMMRNFFENLKAAKGKYIALCEGDDYWTVPFKLQKQVDFLELHEDVSMCFHDAEIIDVKRNVLGNHRRYNKDQYASIKNLILGGGGFCPTASLMFRTQYITSDYPDFCLKCHIGDYALQLYLSTKGKVFYFDNVMSIYRYGVSDSWSHSFQKTEFSLKAGKWISEFDMLDGIDALFGFKYSSVITKKKGRFFIKAILLPNKNMKSEIKKVFEKYLSTFHLEEKIEVFLIYHAFFLYHITSKFLFYTRLSCKMPRYIWLKFCKPR